MLRNLNVISAAVDLHVFRIRLHNEKEKLKTFILKKKHEILILFSYHGNSSETVDKFE